MNPVIYIPLYFGRYLVANLLVAFSVFIIGVQHAQQGQSFLLIIQIDLSVMAVASPLGDSCTEITAKLSLLLRTVRMRTTALTVASYSALGLVMSSTFQYRRQRGVAARSCLAEGGCLYR